MAVKTETVCRKFKDKTIKGYLFVKALDKLPKEYFALTQKYLPEFSRKQLWRGLFIIATFGFVFNPGLLVDLPIAKCVLYIFFAIMLLWIIPCIAFSSKDTLMRNKPTYIILNIICLALFRTGLLNMLALLSACLYCNSDKHPDVIVVYIMYGAAVLISIEDIVVNILTWKLTKKCIIEGEFKKDGKQIFGKLPKQFLVIWTLLITFSPVFIALSRIIFALGKVTDFGIDGHNNYILITVLFILLYHLLMYILAYVDSMWLAQFYYIKRFEQSTPEFKEDKEYGIGFVITRLILAVILIFALYILAVKIGQAMYGI